MRRAHHAGRRPFPWGYFGSGVVLGAFIGSILGAWMFDTFA